MIKDYIQYFLVGSSNNLNSTNFKNHFEINKHGVIAPEQIEFIKNAVKVERNVNLFFAFLAEVFMVITFWFGINQFIKPTDLNLNECLKIESGQNEIHCQNVYGIEVSETMKYVVYGSFIFIQMVILIGFLFKLILPYNQKRLSKIFYGKGKIIKDVINNDSAIIFRIKLEKVCFIISSELANQFEDGKSYLINYVKTPRENLILSFKEE